MSNKGQRKRRSNAFHEPGVRGRATGFAVSTGLNRDQDGLNNVDDFFNSDSDSEEEDEEEDEEEEEQEESMDVSEPPADVEDVGGDDDSVMEDVAPPSIPSTKSTAVKSPLKSPLKSAMKKKSAAKSTGRVRKISKQTPSPIQTTPIKKLTFEMDEQSTSSEEVPDSNSESPELEEEVAKPKAKSSSPKKSKTKRQQKPTKQQQTAKLQPKSPQKQPKSLKTQPNSPKKQPKSPKKTTTTPKISAKKATKSSQKKKVVEEDEDEEELKQQHQQQQQQQVEEEEVQEEEEEEEAKAEPPSPNSIVKTKPSAKKTTKHKGKKGKGEKTNVKKRPLPEPVEPQFEPVLSLDNIDETPKGIRRSARNRMTPCDFWKNERIVYDLESGGVLRATGKLRVPKTDLTTKHRKRRKIEPKERKKTSRKLEPATDDDDNDEKVDAQSADVLENGGNFRVWDWNINPEEMTEESTLEIGLAKTKAMMEWASVSSNKNLAICKVFNLRDAPFASGMLELKPNATKPKQTTKTNYLLFFVVKSSVCVRIHMGDEATEINLPSGSMYFVPPGNAYSIENISDKKKAILTFVQIKTSPAFM